MAAELFKVSGTEVWQGVLFPVTPEVLDRIQLRGVPRQKLDAETVRRAAMKSLTRRLLCADSPSRITTTLLGM